MGSWEKNQGQNAILTLLSIQPLAVGIDLAHLVEVIFLYTQVTCPLFSYCILEEDQSMQLTPKKWKSKPPPQEQSTLWTVWTLHSRSVCPHSLTYCDIIHTTMDLWIFMAWFGLQSNPHLLCCQFVPSLSLEAVSDSFEHPISVCTCVFTCVHRYVHMCAHE